MLDKNCNYGFAKKYSGQRDKCQKAYSYLQCSISFAITIYAIYEGKRMGCIREQFDCKDKSREKANVLFHCAEWFININYCE